MNYYGMTDWESLEEVYEMLQSILEEEE
jgi:hypothetical protein